MVCSPFFLEMVTEDAAVAVALQYMMIALLGMAVMVSVQMWGAVFNALGKPIPLADLQLPDAVVDCALSLLGNNLFGLPGIFLGGILSMFITAIVGWCWFNSL